MSGQPPAWVPDRVTALRRLIEQSDYRGHDPFDLVNSPALSAVPADWARLQFALSRFGSRLAPDWLRALLRVPTIEDPKTYCCCYLAYDLSGETDLALRMLSRLERLAQWTPDGGAYWGYDYRWATKQGVNPRGASTLVPGSFAILALVDGLVVHDHEPGLALLRSAARYYERHHFRSGDHDPALTYFAGSSANTHNANVLGCAALSLAALVLDDAAMARTAASAAGTTIAAVAEDGYLPYSDAPGGEWTDCFHHLYVISALRAVSWANPLVDAEACAAAIDRLWRYWHLHFDRADGMVNYYPDRLTPIDPHNFAIASTVLTLLGGSAGQTRGREILARADALTWDARRRRYVHRVHRVRRDKRLFVRWTQAWMLVALAAATAPDRFRRRWEAYDALARKIDTVALRDDPASLGDAGGKSSDRVRAMRSQ